MAIADNFPKENNDTQARFNSAVGTVQGAKNSEYRKCLPYEALRAQRPCVYVSESFHKPPKIRTKSHNPQHMASFLLKKRGDLEVGDENWRI